MRNHTVNMNWLSRGWTNFLQDRDAPDRRGVRRLVPDHANLLLAVSYQIQEGLMHAAVPGELRMEGCRHGLALAHGDRVVAFAGQHLYLWSDSLDPGRANEDHLDRLPLKNPLPDGAVNLAAVGIAANGDVHCAKTGLARVLDLFRQQDRPGAGPKGGFHAHELFQPLKAGIAKEL